MYQGQREERNRRISRAAKKRAALRTCPDCGRGNALRHHPDPSGCLGSVTSCRWCPYVRVYAPVADVETTS